MNGLQDRGINAAPLESFTDPHFYFNVSWMYFSRQWILTTFRPDYIAAGLVKLRDWSGRVPAATLLCPRETKKRNNDDHDDHDDHDDIDDIDLSANKETHQHQKMVFNWIDVIYRVVRETTSHLFVSKRGWCYSMDSQSEAVQYCSRSSRDCGCFRRHLMSSRLSLEW